jgi:diguanylate cyclase (GGDEF)-like protein/PAS domain S-box-containing protein
MVGMIQDITAHRALERLVAESEARFRLIVETMPAPMVMARMKDGSILYVNPDAAETLGFAVEEAIGRKLSELNLRREDWNALVMAVGNEGVVRRREMSCRRPDGSDLWVLVSASRTEYRGDSVLLLAFKDITEIKRLEVELRKLATLDSLTGISNRRHFMERADTEWKRALRFNMPVTLMMLDIDFFKKINDEYGHEAGDGVLRQITRACGRQLREVDLFARMGGEEFAVMLTQVESAQAVEVAERLREAVDQIAMPMPEGGIVRPTVSVGVVSAPHPGRGGSVSHMLSVADKALYEAKRAGRNRVVAENL